MLKTLNRKLKHRLYRRDYERMLHEFACWCAEQALALVEAPDPHSVEAIATKRRWLRGEATDDELAAAQAAARGAAQAAARGAARDAARAAAWAAALDAAQDAQNEQLETMLRAELGNRLAVTTLPAKAGSLSLALRR